MAKKAYVWDGSNWITIASGALDLNEYLKLSTASSIYLSQSDASTTYLPISASSNYLFIETASSIYLSIEDAEDTYIPITASASIISGLLSESNASNTYAPLVSASLTGTPLAPTAASGTNTTQIATTAFVRTEVSNLVDSAPSTLDTLNELAAALGDDPNFATTVTNSIATKLDAGTASTLYLPISGSVNWSNINNKPDPVITLGGDLSGSVTLTDLTSGTLNATIAANSVALGTDTTGDYVAGLTAGNGISITGAAGEGWSPTVAINSATASVTFANITSKPTTLSGYGITDALPTSASSNFLPTSSSSNFASSNSPTFTGIANFSSINILGTLDAQEIRENVIDISLVSNTATLNWTSGNIYYISIAPTASMTFNVTNVPTDVSKMMTINVFVTQGSTGYIPSVFQIDGLSQTIRWPGGSAPTPTSSAGKIDIFSFTMQRTSGGEWIIYGASSLNF